MQVIVDAVAPGADPAVRLEQFFEHRRRVLRSRQADNAAVGNERELGIIRCFPVILKHQCARLARPNGASRRLARWLVDAGDRFKGLLQSLADRHGRPPIAPRQWWKRREVPSRFAPGRAMSVALTA